LSAANWTRSIAGFVVLADRIKKVQDSHLLELIQDVTSGMVSNPETAGGHSKRFPPATATLPYPRVAVGCGWRYLCG